MNKCVFLDRDGVLNVDDPNFTYHLSRFEIIPGVPEALYMLKEAGFMLVVVTNQSGIAQGIYSQREMELCHILLQQACGHVIDHIYFCPYHPSVTESLTRKPGTLMFEKAIARFELNTAACWMVGDKSRDLVPARQLGIRTIGVGDGFEDVEKGDHTTTNLYNAARWILQGE